jgi:RNA polymerase-interacting CarD/CdnL/TRCF family regulator
MLMQKENFELVEASAGEMIDKLFNLKGNKDAGYGVAKMLSMTGVKVIQAMQKQNPQGFMKTVIALGKEKGKMQIPTNNALMKMFKQQGVKPIPEALDNNDKPKVKEIIKKLKGASKAHAGQAKDLEKAVSEKVKDGKLDPLSKMGKSKLTGSEIQRYYRDNPKQKVAARDKTVKKAIELALDLDGNMNYAMKEIEKIKRGLSKLPAVKLALRHANESKEFTGHHVIIENLSSTDLIKLKTYGKMLAKMTKLQFDDSKPEQSIDKLMGQIWKQKHVPANWERLHKMVALLNKIGVKMPSLKGKYMGLDPVSKKAIFYKEGTDEIVDWHQKIDEIKEEIEDLVEKSEMNWADVRKLGQMTDRNDHNGSLLYLAKLVGNKKAGDALKGIIQTHKALGNMPSGLIDVRKGIYNDLMKQAKSKYSNYNDIYKSF